MYDSIFEFLDNICNKKAFHLLHNTFCILLVVYGHSIDLFFRIVEAVILIQTASPFK